MAGNWFGSGDDETNTFNTQVGASDDGTIVGDSGAGARDSGTAITSGASGQTKINTSDTILSGEAVILSRAGDGSLLNSTNSGTITYGLSGDDLRASLVSVTEGIGDILKDSGGKTNEQISSTISLLSDLATSKQTDGESTRDNTILYVIVAGLAFLAFFFWKK